MLLLILAVLSIPVLYIKNSNPEFSWYFNLLAVFAVSTLIFFACYYTTYVKIHGKSMKNFFSFVGLFFAFFSVAMGLSVHNTVAVLEGHFGKRSEFIRTPKFNVSNLKDSWKGNIYLKKNISANMVIEAMLLFYFAFGIYSAFILEDYGLLVFHLMLFGGFGFVVFNSFSAKG